jgi:hypothetical protein
MIYPWIKSGSELRYKSGGVKPRTRLEIVCLRRRIKLSFLPKSVHGTKRFSPVQAVQRQESNQSATLRINTDSRLK